MYNNFFAYFNRYVRHVTRHDVNAPGACASVLGIIMRKKTVVKERYYSMK